MGKMGRTHDITLTPRDFNYDNHHYQYLKYTKRGKVSSSRSLLSARRNFFPEASRGIPASFPEMFDAPEMEMKRFISPLLCFVML